MHASRGAAWIENSSKEGLERDARRPTGSKLDTVCEQVVKNKRRLELSNSEASWWAQC